MSGTKMSSHEDDDYFLPLVDQRVFGAGIKRKRIAFVPATSEHDPNFTQSLAKQNAGDRYLSIVLKGKASTDNGDEQLQDNRTPQEPKPTEAVCPVCGQTIVEGSEQSRHESSLAHQVCLQHSHPPSHLDRSHVGLKYLQGYGWDPDARTGLGARSEGIRIPIKAKEKNNSAGLGTERNEEESTETVAKRKIARASQATVRLNAKDVRRMEMEKSKRAERLRRDVYGQDLSQYLGSNG